MRRVLLRSAADEAAANCGAVQVILYYSFSISWRSTDGRE
jgi:hypothetical protein